MELMDVLVVLLYVFGIGALIALIALLVKAIKTLEKVDRVIDDAYLKSQKLNGLFDIVDKLELLNDRLIDTIIKGVMNLFSRKKKGDETNE